MLTSAEIDQVRDALMAADYTADAVLARIGVAGQAGLGRNSTFPAAFAVAADSSALATLVTLFLLQRPVLTDNAEAAFGPALDPLLRAGYLTATSSLVRAGVDIRPYGSDDDGAGGWVVSDLTPGLDGHLAQARPDYVLGVSPASTTLAQLTIRQPVRSALDLGTGCGVQSLHLARHADHVVATDVNPRALELAGVTAALNGLSVDLRAGSLYEPVAHELFDLIVTNPPYVMAPPRAEGERLTYREGGLRGDQLVEAVVTQGPRHLTPGGTLQVLGNWAILRDTAWEERLAGWVRPSGADLLVLERERLDPYEYIEIWLADAGLHGSRTYPERYREWVSYFDTLGVEAIGMGWISVHNAGRADPHVQIEQWPHAVHQPVGDAFLAHQRGVTLAARSDTDLLGARLVLTDTGQETFGEPGAADPTHVVLRQTSGFGRAHRVDTATGGVLGACDGELSLGRIIAAVAAVLDADQNALTETVLPVVRQFALDGMLSEL